MKSLRTFATFWIGVLGLYLLSSGSVFAGGEGPSPVAALTAQTTAFLQKFVNKDGRVDHEAIQRNSDLLEDLLLNIACFDAANASPADQYAFYLNAYNMLAIGEIVRDYPLVSVQEVPGFFNRNRFRVGGEELTLDQVETDKLRRIYDDPRLHFALVCGTNSCPRLRRSAHVGSQLFEQLNSQAKAALLDPAYIQVDEASKVVRLPEIFKWYAADFGASGKPGVLYVNQFRKEHRVPTWFAVEYYSYDWSLNDQHADGVDVASMRQK